MKLQQYSSLEEKKKIFRGKYKRFNTRDDFDRWFSGNHGRYFRGVKEASYKNYTSAQRLFITHDLAVHGLSINDLVRQQIDSLKAVREGLIDNYFSSLIRHKPNDLLLLSFAQHQKKGIAPLLDFTLDRRVALYFMADGCEFPKLGKDHEDGDISSIEDYASLYYLTGRNKISYKRIIDSVLSDKLDRLNKFYQIDNINEENIKGKNLIGYINRKRALVLRFINHNLLDSDVTDIILDSSDDNDISTPGVMLSNLNITAQNGCFVYHNNELLPFEDLYCVDIHKSLVPYIRRDYLVANGSNDFKTTISEQTVYPDAGVVVEEALNDALSELIQ